MNDLHALITRWRLCSTAIDHRPTRICMPLILLHCALPFLIIMASRHIPNLSSFSLSNCAAFTEPVIADLSYFPCDVYTVERCTAPQLIHLPLRSALSLGIGRFASINDKYLLSFRTNSLWHSWSFYVTSAFSLWHSVRLSVLLHISSLSGGDGSPQTGLPPGGRQTNWCIKLSYLAIKYQMPYLAVNILTIDSMFGCDYK